MEKTNKFELKSFLTGLFSVVGIVLIVFLFLFTKKILGFWLALVISIVGVILLDMIFVAVEQIILAIKSKKLKQQEINQMKQEEAILKAKEKDINDSVCVNGIENINKAEKILKNIYEVYVPCFSPMYIKRFTELKFLLDKIIVEVKQKPDRFYIIDGVFRIYIHELVDVINKNEDLGNLKSKEINETLDNFEKYLQDKLADIKNDRAIDLDITLSSLNHKFKGDKYNES